MDEGLKPGWKTTEFWLVGLFPQVLGILVVTGVIGPEQQVLIQDGVEVVVAQGTTLWGSLINLAGALGYGIARGLAKLRN